MIDPKDPNAPDTPEDENQELTEEELAAVPEQDRKSEIAMRRKVKKTTRNPEEQRNALRRYTHNFYDIQRLRIQTAGRTYDRATGAEIQLNEVDIAIFDARANALLRAERDALADIKAFLPTIPAYTQILSEKPRFRGLGPTMAAVILSEVDINRCNTISALWRYAGLAPIKGHRCSVCKDTVVKRGKDKKFVHEFERKKVCKAKLTSRIVYESTKSERPVKGQKLAYNRFLKTKMVGVLAGCLLKANSPYREYYDNYKHRLISGKRGRDDGHRHQMSMRYMVKMLLLDIWKDWRELEGLPVRNLYQEEYLDHQHVA